MTDMRLETRAFSNGHCPIGVLEDSSLIIKRKRNRMSGQTPTECQSPMEEDVFLVEMIETAPTEPPRALQNLFGPTDASWIQDPAKDMPDLPIPEGYDPEAERRRVKLVGHRYEPPKAPFKGTTLREVRDSDFRFSLT
jgi:hypothetical protein